ncbi:MAG TPA: TnsA endonuclease N-terminal domain-containing protein [Cyclobacteriaceae bacterium]|jgi:hypothetical protein|nr:TnsA endonuclease N-terminal domain-containing protein [Cyclobacteriaceae bacterium]
MKSRISDETRLKRGLGQGHGANYKPFIRPRHFSSKGCTTRIAGDAKIDREFIVLSNLEENYSILFRFNPAIKDIQEQYPLLPLSSTQQIAANLNIIHPHDEKNKDVVMTTDFLLTVDRAGIMSQKAVTVKPSSLITKRVLQKFQIEKEWWKQRDVEWCIVTEKQLDQIKLNNVKFLREYFTMDSLLASVVFEEFKRCSLDKNLLLREFVKQSALKLRIQFGDCCRIFYHLLATQRVWFDIGRSLNLDMQLFNFKIIADETINK